MKKKFLLVDGYNIIHNWSDLKQLVDVNLEMARQALIDILSNHQGLTKEIIIIVFDGHLVKGNIGTKQKINNIYVIFTKEKETADNYIEKTVRELPKNYKVRVATSDLLEQLIIIGQGAIRLSAKDLEIEVKEEKIKMNEKFIYKKPAKNNMLFDNLNDDMKDLIEKMRREK